MAQTNPNQQPSDPVQKKVVVPVNKQPQPSWKPSANQQARLNQMYKDWETKENKTYVSRDGTSYRPAPKTDVTVPEGTRQFSYWEHPQKVVRYYNLIRSARPDWTPPDWLDVKGVTQAYEYLKFRNGDVPTSEWKALPEDDEGTVYLRNLGTPPMQVLTQSEINAESAIKTDEELAQSQINWKDLPAWQRFALATTMPGSSGITDRPEWTKLTAASINSLLMAAGVGKAVSAINPIAGVAAGLLLAGGLTYQSYTGTKIPVINEIILASNALSEGVERIIGVGKQTTVDGLDEVLGELPSAWKASQATYETGPTNYLNALAWISNIFTPDEKDSKLAGKDEVWRFEQGITTPVKLTGGAVKGAEYLSQSRDWIEQGKALEEFNTAINGGTFTGTYQEYVYNKLTEQYGITGVINDLVAQTILDPLNAMPFMTGKVGSATLAKVASSSSNPTVKRVAGTASVAFEVGTGKFAIDALPMGLQQVVAGITKQKSSQGIVGSLEIYRDWIRTGFYPDVVKNLPDDMRVHYDSLLKQGVKQADIKVLGDTITWKDKTGAEQAFKGSGASKFVVPEIKDLSPLEKFIGGIDDEYGLKELRPTKGQSFFKKLTQLTPEAQTLAMLNIFHHNVATLMDIANGDPEKMGAALYKLAGKVEVKPGDMGESILKSPAAKAVQAAAQYALKDGDIIQTELTNWNMGAERRAMLTNIANALNETPAKVLEQFKDNPSAMAERLSKIAPEMKTTPEFLESTLNVFVGDNPMPWNVEQFQATLVNSFANKLDDFFKDKYGLSQDSWVFRVSNALKGVQSLVLLGFNPAYFMNNWVNNVITRAADGVGGYMTPKQVNDFYTRLGIFPKDTGLSSFDEITGMVISKAKDAQVDMIDKAQKAISTVNKVGVFSRLSGKMEKAEGDQARVIAMTQFMDKTKKVGVGIGRMDVALENLLDTQYPGMKEKVYGAINAGMNMKEIEQSIFNQEYRPRVETIIDELGTKYDGNNPGSTRELLRKTNMIERMNDRLKNAKTPDDVDNAFYGVMDDFEEWVNKQTVNDMVSKAEETKNMVQSEKIPAVLQIMSDQAIDTGQKWINQRKDYEGLYDRLNAGDIDYEQFIKEIEYLDTKHQAEVRRANDVNLQAYKGIVDALGIDNEYTRGYITKIGEINNTWQGFWETRRKLFKEYSQLSKRGKDENVSTWRQRKNDLWNKLQDTLENEYNKATDMELVYQAEMDGNFVQGYADYTGWDQTAAGKYRGTILEMRKQIIDAQKEMRKRTRGLDFTERDAEYKKFNPVYNQMIQKMKQFEHDGAYQLMNKPIPEARIDVPEVEKAVNPNVDSMELSDMSATPEELAAMKAQAKQMLGLSDEQLDTLYPKQIAQAVNQEIRRIANIKRLNDSAKSVVRAKITAEDIIMQADNAKRKALLHEQGMLARSDVEDQLRKAFKNSSEAEIQATMTLIDKYIDQWSKKQGYAPTDGTRDAWYATHIKEIKGIDDLNNALNQSDVSPKGSISFENDGRAIVRALNSPDVSTMVHELGHIFLRDLSDADLNIVAKHGGLVDAAELKDMMIAFQSGELHQGMDGYSKYVKAEEAFARGWERYLAEGDAPTPALKSVFRKFTDWMMSIYTSLKKKSGRVTGFENTPLDIDINVKIDGVSLKDIFDRMFTDKADRAPSFDSLLSDRFQDIKGRGRNYRFNDADLTSMARKELLTELLGEYPDEAQARAFADSMTDYIYLKDGTKIDDVTIYDALAEAANDLNANPWVKTEYKQGDQLAQPDTGAAEGVRAAQTGSENIQGVDSSALAKSIIDAETKADYDAGQPVSIDRAGEIDISHRDILPVPEDVQNVIATADMFRFSKKQQAKDYVQWVIDGEKGARPDVSQDVIDSYVNSIDILRDYAVKKSSGITPSEIIKSEIIEPTNAELVKTAKNYTKDLPAEILEKVYHKAFDLIEENVEGGADTSYSRYKLYYKTAQELHSYLRDNIGKDPNITLERNGYKYSSDAGNIILEAPSHKGGGYYLDFSASTERVAKNIASQNGINQPGITIQKVFKFKHGEADCVANVYKDGELIAYATEAPLKDARIDQDTRLLGLDPDNPNRWVYERDGEIKSVDATKPTLDNGQGELYQGATANIDTPEFKAWFGDSKVVDENGKPLVVYHGTPEQFNVFDFSKVRTNGTSEGVGFYFTDSKQIASGYTRGKNLPMEEYLSINKPMAIDQKKITKSQLKKIIQEIEKTYPDALANYGDYEYFGKAKVLTDAINIEWDGNTTDIDIIASLGNGGMADFETINRAVVKVTGYDGVIVDWNHTNPPSKVYVAFLPEQIKSVNNQGTWDANNPNTLFQDGTRSTADLAESIKNKSIDDMDLDELRYALTHDKLTGIKNRTAYESAAKLPVQVVLDVEGLKYVNDNFGHPVGDDVLRALAKSVAEASDEAYRGSDRADEFIMQFNTEAEAQAAIAKVEQVLSEQKVTLNGEEWQGFGFSHGVGKTLAEADAALNKNKTYAISEGKRANRGEKPVNLQPVENSAAPMGKVPLDGTPVTEPFGRVLDEVNSEYIRPVLQDIRNAYKKKMAEGPTELGNMSKADVKTLRQYLNGTVAPDLSSVKRAALTYGDTMRNNALLDYSRRYGFDNVLNIVYPYQFWYTRSMMNWAKRMVDKPSWFSMYARLQQVQQKMERDGMPTRLKGKVRFSMPWMPEWMGGGLWTDPMAKIFPFDQFGQPFEQYSLNRNQVYKRAESIIDDMRSTEKITQDEASEALATRAGSAWERAVSQAEVELDKSSNPATLATMMMQPALWWNIASNVAQDTPEKIGVMPVTRTGQTIRELGSDTFLEPITDVVGGIMAYPEEKIREKAGLSQFGEWGDYYLDRTMASMAANGEITAEQARIAMIQRSGEVYDEAVSRVSQEQAIRQPGAAGIMALKEGAGIGQSLISTIEGIFGGSLYSEGEMKMRGLKAVYDNAWKKFKAGDEDAINQFFEDYPEYYARLALYDEPEERLHQFLVDSIWKKYMDLETANKKIARESLGDDFVTSFLNKETRDYDAIDDKTLAKWSQMLGTSELPEVDATTDAQKTQQIQYLPDEITTEINAYYDEKNKLFPSSTMWQNAYYELPAGSQRKTFLAQHPELKEYWDWKKKYVEEHPEVGEYLEELQQDHTADEVSSELTSPLIRQLLVYATGGNLSSGARSELARIKEQLAPDMTDDEFVQLALSLLVSNFE